MTMHFERIRALCWAREALSEICGDVLFAKKYRAKAAELLRTYPSPAMVSQWIDGDVTCIPANAAAAIEEAGALMRLIRYSTSYSGTMRRSLHFLLQNFPEPGTAGRWAQSATAWTIRTWLRPEDQYAADEFCLPRPRAGMSLEGAPATRAVLEAHPDMWPRISSAVPAGWDHEIAQALQAIVVLAAETGVEIRVSQIKSELASLRIYVDIDEDSLGPAEIIDSTPINARLRSSSTHGSVRDRAREIVDAAAERCASRCELCGAPSILTDGGWIRIPCSVHAAWTRNGDCGHEGQ